MNRFNNLLNIFAIFFIIIFIIFCLWAWPQYRVYNRSMRGNAELQEAEYTRRIATLDAQAEIERAKGVARANEIIGSSLRGNDEYLRYLWITNLDSGTDQVIYIPTEAGLPILEAGRNIRIPIE